MNTHESAVDMTDKETLLALLKKIDAEPQEGYGDYTDENYTEDGIVAIVAHASGPNVVGYSWFLTKFHFDEAGNLIKIGIWE